MAIALTVLMISNTASLLADTLHCPEQISPGGRPRALQRGSVFDGPPKERADLIPVEGKWDLAPYRSENRDLYLVCRYQKTDQTTTFVIPRHMMFCAETGTTVVSVTCH